MFPTHLNPNNFLFYITSNFTPIHVYPRVKMGKVLLKSLGSDSVLCFMDEVYSLHRHPTTTVYNHTEFSSTSRTREPGTRIAHPGPKKLTILCDQVRITPIVGRCRRKWVPPKMTRNASRGCTIPVWIQSKTLIRVSNYLVGNEIKR